MSKRIFINMPQDAIDAYIASMKVVFDTADAEMYRKNWRNASGFYQIQSGFESEDEFLASCWDADRKHHMAVLADLHSLIEHCDADRLKSRLWYQNKASRSYFEAVTGVRLGKSDKTMRAAIDAWIASVA